MEGFVYIMVSTDPCWENRIKVGFSNNPERRRRELSGTSVPYPFEIRYAWAVDNMLDAENVAHYMLREQRVTSNREFFDIIPIDKLDSIIKEFVDTELGVSREDVFQECVHVLRGLIDDAFEHSMFRSYSVDVDDFVEYDKQKRKTKKDPENPNRFAALF